MYLCCSRIIMVLAVQQMRYVELELSACQVMLELREALPFALQYVMVNLHSNDVRMTWLYV
ncbi:hypothetical protein PILCRDRAFT_813015, partial [Piloderma croceum F 1598]